MGIWNKIEKAVYGVAEGIGKKFEQGAALPGKGANWVKGGGLQSAIHSIRSGSALGGMQKKLSASGFVNSPREYLQNLGQAGRNFGGALKNAGFVGSPREYAQNVGHAARNFGTRVGPATGRGMQRAGSGLRSLLGGGTAASGGGSAGPTDPTKLRKINEQYKKMAGPQGLPLITKLFTALGAGAALGGAVALFKKMTFGMSDANRDLAKWNGAIAASFAKLDIQSMRLDIQTARASAGGAATLNDAIAELKTEFQPIRENTARLLNIVGVMGVNALKTALAAVKAFAANNDLLKGIQEAIDEAEKNMKKDKNEQFPGNQALEAIARLPVGGLPGGGPQQNHDVGRARGAFVNHPRRRLRLD